METWPLYNDSDVGYIDPEFIDFEETSEKEDFDKQTPIIAI